MSNNTEYLVGSKEQIINDLKVNFKKTIIWYLLGYIGYVTISSCIMSSFESMVYLKGLYYTLNTTAIGVSNFLGFTAIVKILTIINSIVGFVVLGIILSLITLSFQSSSHAQIITSNNYNDKKINEKTHTITQNQKNVESSIIYEQNKNFKEFENILTNIQKEINNNRIYRDIRPLRKINITLLESVIKKIFTSDNEYLYNEIKTDIKNLMTYNNIEEVLKKYDEILLKINKNSNK